jgi:glycosyltransferase involved in cell wall biosynthesis
MTKVSVVIPCRNEKKYIAACVNSVLVSDCYNGDIEVLVCDGMSDDGTIDIVRDLERTDKRVRLIANEKRSTPFALNLGAKNAKGEVVIILGAHSEVDRNYLRVCYDALAEERELGCVGGLLENVFEDETSEAVAKAMSSPFGVGTAHFRTGAKDGYVDTVAFGAYKREVFEKAGYFDEELVRNQDDEFNYRVVKAGFRIKLISSIKARYFVRASFRKLFRQYFQYGYWKVFVNRKHGAVTSIRQLIPPLFVLFLALGWIPSLFWFPLMFLYAAGLGIYLLASVISAMKGAKNFSSFFKTLLSFYILHLSYGAGYIEGIFRFIVFGKDPGKSKEAMSR